MVRPEGTCLAFDGSIDMMYGGSACEEEATRLVFRSCYSEEIMARVVQGVRTAPAMSDGLLHHCRCISAAPPPSARWWLKLEAPPPPLFLPPSLPALVDNGHNNNMCHFDL